MSPLKTIETRTQGRDKLVPLLHELAEARFDHDPARAHDVLGRIGFVLARIQASSDMIGRASMRLKLSRPRGKRAPLRFAMRPGAQRPGEVPHVLPWDAILDLIDRDPVFARSAEEVREVYSQDHGFALARALDATVTSRVHDAVVNAFHAGKPLRESRDLVFGLGQEQGAGGGLESWTKSYAETVVRTNATTAYAAGEFREAEALEAEGRIAGLRFVSSLDVDTRPNHRAAHGLIARVSDPIWDMLSPPLGFNAVERGAMIMTDQGERPVQEVRVGDRVWTFQGEYARVYGVDAKVEKKRMVRLELEGDHAVSVSVEHPVLTKRGWVAAGKLREDDEIAVSGCRQCSKPVPTWREFCGTTCRNRSLSTARSARAGTKGRTCAPCGKTFDATNARSRFCSLACKHEAQRVHRNCKVCGTEIKLRGKKKPRVVCSKKCLGMLQRTKDRPCEKCGKSVREVLKKAGIPFGPKRRFCSFRCWRRFNGETSIERTVREYLEANALAFVQNEQVGRYEVDFLLPMFSVVVECDGTYWHSSASVKARDARKDDMLAKKGYKVVRLTEVEIKIKAGTWKEKVYAVCKDQVDQARGAVG